MTKYQRKMSKLTNMYYSQYESSIESEAAYDSDNSDTYEILIRSPSHAKFYKYIEYRNAETFLHESWKSKIHEQANAKKIAKNIKEQCGMVINLADNRVCYIYKPIVDETHLPGIKFKITFIYVKLLRKWYISLGRSRLPDIITLDNKLKNGTHDPIGPKILKLICKIKRILDIFIQKLEYVCKMVDHMKGAYKDIRVQLNKSLTNIKIMLCEKAWPKDVKKSSAEDIIILDIMLGDNFETDELSYEYMHKRDISAEQKRMYIFELEKKIKIFFYLPLMEAFGIFMNEKNFSNNEVSSS
ncbi:uncharacterized protein LOC122528026 [Frieseomelitta varia]|uniref:uncharacterized protein LOC122528026 n=1 Tax=Frieseomelitta varia TaxID=561572 RepID=UPI001CB6A823|nr:uncharacterized protein LOC122528026 [Frieseomelitta varia]